MKKLFTVFVMLNAGLAAFAALSDAPPSSVVESLASNRFYTESIRNNNLAKLAFADGNYDMSIQYSAESIRNARLSDEYVTQRLKIAAAVKKIDEAGSRLSWADKANAAYYFPNELDAARNFYREALAARAANEWDTALNNAINVVETLANVTVPQEQPDKIYPLPSQYKVRPWDAFGDCFWNIAGRNWVYNNPLKWPLLYKANKSKLPNPDDPNLIEPGLILDIPSLNGEKREGMWDSGRAYSPVP
jgi:nucleoid-associated protein YgaU